MIFPSPPMNRNFLRPKGLPMSRADARVAVPPKRNNPAGAVITTAVTRTGASANCTRRYAIPAELRLRFHFNPAVINRFIAVIASNPSDNTKPFHPYPLSGLTGDFLFSQPIFCGTTTYLEPPVFSSFSAPLC